MPSGSNRKLVYLVVSFVIMLVVAFLPKPAGVTLAGQRIIAVLIFAVIIWITEACSYGVSSMLIVTLLIIFLGISPAGNATTGQLGTLKAIPMAMSGFGNPGWLLVAAGLFMAACITHTGLEKRLALKIMQLVGAKVNNFLIAMIVIPQVLAFLMPSMAARAATITPTAVGVITALKLDRKSVFARITLLTFAFATGISGIGVLSGSGSNPFTVGLLMRALNKNITWGEWLIYSYPFVIVMCVILYFLMTRCNKFEFNEIPGGRAQIDKLMADLGKMSKAEIKIAIIFAATIVMWATEKVHGIDSNTTAAISVCVMMMPYIGVAGWKEISAKVEWGAIVLFGAGMSLGELFYTSGAAVWTAKVSLGSMGIDRLSPPMMILVIACAGVIIRFAFSSVTAAAVTVVPTVLGLLISFNKPGLPMWGIALVTCYLVYFTFIMPVNSPHFLIPYSTDTFELKDTLRLGIPLTLIGVLMLVVFSYTYWHWVGVL